MLNLDFTFLFTAINLLVLYFAVKHFLFGRLSGFMEKRSAAITTDIENGKAMKAEGEAYRAKYEQLLNDAAEQSRQILADARVRADREYDTILARARDDAEQILIKAGEDAKLQQERLYKQITADMAELSILAASKVVEANMDTEINRHIAKSFLENEGAA